MRLIINGENKQIAEEQVPVTRLLSIINVESPDMVSVQVNGEIIDRNDFESTLLKENDEVDFLYFMGGGCGA